MTRLYEDEIAIKYGVEAAILFQNIAYWCEHNRANDQNYHDGLYWTYNSTKAFTEMFPYFGRNKIRSALQKLIDNELIVTGNYNNNRYDRTTWYAVTDYGWGLLKMASTSIVPNSEMQSAETEQSKQQNAGNASDQKPKIEATENQKSNSPKNEIGMCENHQPIPNMNQYIYTNKNTNKSSSSSLEDELEIRATEDDDNPFGERDARPVQSTVQKYVMDNTQCMSANNMQELVSFVQVLPDDVIEHAVDIATGNGVRTWYYIRAVLNNYVDNRVRNLDDAKSVDAKLKRKRKSKYDNDIFSREPGAEIHPLSADDRYI